MIKINSDGILLILSSPSGAGKTTIAKAIQSRDSNTTISVSCTTRAKRPNEVNYKDYHFVDSDSFLYMVSKEKFLEYAIIYGNLYGTPKDSILDHVSNGRDIIFDIDWQGARSIKQKIPQHVVSIFILPPSLDVLRKRLESRSIEDFVDLERRFKEAINEISHYTEYDFVVVNDDLDKATEEVHNILKSERVRRERRKGIADFICNMK